MFLNFARLFLLATATFLVLPIAGTIAFIRSPLFERTSQYSYDILLAEKARAEAPDTKILFVGDSSLLAGVMPRLLDDRLGLRSYNLGLVAFAGYEPMLLTAERFIERNGRPDIIVFYLSATTPAYDANRRSYERVVARTRHGEMTDVLSDFLQHPVDFSTVLHNTLRRLASPREALGGRTYRTVQTALAERRGYLAITTQGRREAALADDCRLETPVSLPAQWNETLAEARARLETFAPQVLVYIAPMPACDAALPRVEAIYTGIADNRVRSMENRLFIDHTHLTPEGAAANSAIVASEIEALSAKPGR